MTLLERWDAADVVGDESVKDEIRRAIAIAQKVQQHADGGSLYAQAIINEADELLEGK